MAKNVVLVHGAWADGSGWKGVYGFLKSKGYHVTVVPCPNTSLEADVAVTNAVLDQQDGPAVLVGHSYGGAVITVAGSHPKAAALVYIAAFAPDAGESLLQILQSGPPDPNSPVLPPADGWIWLDKSRFHAGFCADLDVADAAFMADSQPPVAVEAFASVLKDAAWKSLKTWYVVAGDDKMIPPDAQRSMAARAHASVSELASSHAVYISHAAEVAAVIEEALQTV